MRFTPVSLMTLSFVLLLSFNKPADMYSSSTGFVSFISKAQLEKIEAQNDHMHAALNRTDKTLAFKVPITSFEGFNSNLQREHFNENYMESNEYEFGTFEGKIIETIDLKKEGLYEVRAKGMLAVHGIEIERVIPGTIKVNEETIIIQSQFDINLEDHDIKTPRIVNQKIAEAVNVTVRAELSPDRAW